MIHTRQFASSLVIRDNGDGRTLVGPLLPWGVRARVVDRGRLVTETFERGALAGTDPAKVPLTATHARDAGTLPIGVTVELEDRADAAWGAWHVSDTVLGNEVLELASDGVPLGLSVGFAEVSGGSRWSADRQRVTRISAALDHVAVVRVPAYVGAGVVGVRGDTAPRPPRSCSCCWVAVGKSSAYYSAPQGARRQPWSCVGCKKPIVWGDRCEACKKELRRRVARKRR